MVVSLTRRIYAPGFLPAESLLPQVVPPLFLSLVENGIPLSSEKASPKVEESESYPDKESL